MYFLIVSHLGRHYFGDANFRAPTGILNPAGINYAYTLQVPHTDSITGISLRTRLLAWSLVPRP